MTIKEIAKLAGVSPSTVSKIINRKDESISEDTRNHVLDIVEKYNYSPIAKALERASVNTRLVGVVAPNTADSYFAKIIHSLERAFSKRGYSLIVCNTDGDCTTEIEALSLLKARHVECLVVLCEKASPELETNIIDCDIPYIAVNPGEDMSYSAAVALNYKQAISSLMQIFFSNNHDKVALVIQSEGRCFKSYYRDELEKSGQVFDDSMVFEMHGDNSNSFEILDTVLKTGYRAILADSMKVANALYTDSYMRHMLVGSDFSMVAFDDQGCAETLSPKLTCAKPDFGEMANAIASAALSITEGKVPSECLHIVDAVLYQGNSVSENTNKQRPHIAVIGTINMDVMLEVPHLPNAGETLIITEKTILPGGKGANQAVGAAKLGAEVSMIGRLGNDLYGKELFHNLHSANINITGVDFDNQYQTGRAYIYVTDYADYSIGVHAGANDGLDCKQIDKYTDIIRQTSYCLVQTEIPMGTVEYLGEICAKNNINMILKPSPAKTLSDELLKNIYMLVPNEVEISNLVPGPQSLEDKVKILLDRGTPRVVLTLGEKGCYYADKQKKQYFKPMNVEVVDTAGASDAFISALAVYLAEGINMERAIDYANIAAGISISRIGVQSALADRNTIEAKYKQKEKGLE